jgi:tetratricopeptide (TPR) repeat protein
MWRLIGRHKASGEILSYAAWYFARERSYDELSLLLKNARLPGAEADAAPLAYWEAFDAARVSDNGKAIEILEAYSKANGYPWFAEANIGLYLEAERSWAAAERKYYNALSRTELPRIQARILERISRCHTAQGRPNEARAALEEALLLDPDNLKARTGLSLQSDSAALFFE